MSLLEYADSCPKCGGTTLCPVNEIGQRWGMSPKLSALCSKARREGATIVCVRCGLTGGGEQ